MSWRTADSTRAALARSMIENPICQTTCPGLEISWSEGPNEWWLVLAYTADRGAYGGRECKLVISFRAGCHWSGWHDVQAECLMWPSPLGWCIAPPSPAPFGTLVTLIWPQNSWYTCAFLHTFSQPFLLSVRIVWKKFSRRQVADIGYDEHFDDDGGLDFGRFGSNAANILRIAIIDNRVRDDCPAHRQLCPHPQHYLMIDPPGQQSASHLPYDFVVITGTGWHLSGDRFDSDTSSAGSATSASPASPAPQRILDN